MDIVTHALMGGVLVSPFIVDHPVESSCFVMGAVLPDIDALSRIFGKNSFLKAHQTITHSFSAAALFSAACGLLLFPWAGLALCLGMILHSMLDVSNTFGAAVLWPFSKRRFYLEWVFFIDAFVIGVSSLALLGIYLTWREPAGPDSWLALVYGGSLGVYWFAKAWLRSRVARFCPAGTLSVIPSMVIPWHFLGLSRSHDLVVTFQVNAITGRITDRVELEILDSEYEEKLVDLPEFEIMRRLTPAYHVVEARESDQGTVLTCRDLRTRNMKTRFGQLEVTLDPAGQVADSVFHV